MNLDTLKRETTAVEAIVNRHLSANDIEIIIDGLRYKRAEFKDDLFMAEIDARFSTQGNAFEIEKAKERLQRVNDLIRHFKRLP